MDIQSLKEFVDLSETLSFSKTAENMYIARPTLSKHIQQLEEELEVQLFVRNKQSVRLTNIGRKMLGYAKKMLILHEESLLAIRQSKLSMTGEVRVGFLHGATREILVKSINRFRKQYPEMNIHLVSGQLGELQELFRNNKIDVALTILFEDSVLLPDVNFKLLYEEGIAAVIPHNCSLIKKDSIYFEDLLDYPMILPSPIQFPMYADMVRKHVEAADKKANIICDYTHVNTAMIMTESGMGVCILPTDMAPASTTAVFKPIVDFNPVLRVGIMWKNTNSAIGLNEFIDATYNVINESETCFDK